MSILENKIALVTGGAQGIGRAISVALASEGAHVAFSDIQMNQATEDTKELIRSKGVKAMALQSDVRDFSGTQVEFARNVLGWTGANSTEIDLNTAYPVISMLSEQKNVQNLGGTMRLGAYPCEIKEGTLAYQAYEKKLIRERHRHRYEFNNDYKKAFEEKGMVFSGTLERGSLCEISEISSHPWMLGVQFHPEFKSKPIEPHPLFRQFIEAICYGPHRSR